MRRATWAFLFAVLAACNGTGPGRALDEDDGGGGPPPPSAFELVRPKQDGFGQVGTVAEYMPQPFVVRVMHNGSPVAGIVVTWVTNTPAARVEPAALTTDLQGYSSAYFLAGTTAGSQGAQAVLDEQELVFIVTANGADPASMEAVAGPDSARVGHWLIFRVAVFDIYGNRVTDVPVMWTLASGDITTFAPEGTSAAILFSQTPGPVVVTAALPGRPDIPSITFQGRSF